MSLALEIILWVVGIIVLCVVYDFICYAVYKTHNPKGNREDYQTWKEKLFVQVTLNNGDWKL